MPGKKLILPLVLFAALLTAVPSFADDAERQTYKAEVEPICKVNSKANEKILKGVRQLVKAGKLDAAAKQFRAAAKESVRRRAGAEAHPHRTSRRPEAAGRRHPADQVARLREGRGHSVRNARAQAQGQ